MGIEEILGKAWEGLGNSLHGLTFVVVSVEGDSVRTDFFPEQFDKTKYAPFDYKPGQRYSRDIWQNGEFVISENPENEGEAYLVLEGGASVKVEGELDTFIETIQMRGKQNKFNRLLKEGKIVAGVRTHAYDGSRALLEVIMAQEQDFTHQYGGIVENVFEAYSILVNLADDTAGIIEGTYEAGSFNENVRGFKAVKPIKLNSTIIETAKLTDPFSNIEFTPLPKELVAYIRENAFRFNPQ